ncbi:hypothetical protein BOO71_0001039 [Deinococcus marmoris]|uniref:Uncharacterized protein n=1 Tax=Deinococcus marmoris TaxID=249408 RepID=A0A1U7P4C5_9DEIO|nr:hypothetical protein BOO71_0001039 [Deinococcus marmoris]
MILSGGGLGPAGGREKLGHACSLLLLRILSNSKLLSELASGQRRAVATRCGRRKDSGDSSWPFQVRS